MIGHFARWGVLVSLMIAAICGERAFAQTPGQTTSLSKPAAIVNGEPISTLEVDTIVKSRGPTAVKLTQAQEREMQRDAISFLIDQLLLEQFMRKNGPKVDPAEINKQLGELETALKKKNKTLQEYFRDINRNEAQVRADIAKEIQLESFINTRITEPDLKRYYDENKDFFDQVKVRCSHIVLRLAPNATDAERQAAKNKLLGLRQEIVTGKLDFAEAAKKNSQCPSAPEGGDIGPISRKFQVEEPFARAAFALKVGEVSDIVQTGYGLHVIKATDRKPGESSEYAKIKDAVKECYGTEMVQNLLNELRKSAKIDIQIQ
jgi:parvulin-like peptidyl-prolyl isomerase